ncbi:MAG TPA: TIGR03617 family F420-dependent LLM class oxidoreductase [Methylomirabilota bacterium]|nr:TIGR03617 family F420-dependent LLM class oxidoreductase [Methylomirabilota bacterium]
MSVKLDLGFMTFDLREIPAYARRAEELGVGALWSAETKHDPFLPLAVAAANTSRIQLGTAIAVAFPRSPMILAHTAWDLQKASGGRFVLGLGTQVKAHNLRRFSVAWEPPGPRLREVVLALRAIWASWQSGAPLDFRGQFYRFDLMTPFFNPGPIEHPRIPIYIAAVNPYMAQMAGEICDGLHVHSFHSPKYLREVIHPAVEVGLGKSGRTRKDFTFRASTMVVVGDDADELERSRRAVKQQIAFYASTRTYQAVLGVHGLDRLVPRLHAKSLEGDWHGMADLISDETLDHFAVTATWGTLGARLRERYDGICERTQLYPAFQPSLDDPRLQALLKEMNAG